jgi:hypothetical protein
MVKLYMKKRGQISIFVIVAIVVVGIIVLIFAFPNLNVFVSDVNPSSFLRECVKGEIDNNLGILSKQGGYLNPENYVMYQGNRIQYLCYTSESYLPCKVQQPLLVKHVEDELKRKIKPRAQECVQELKAKYESQGYSVRTTPGDVTVSIAPGSIIVDFLSPMSVTKESSQTFERFAVAIDSEMYDLLSTATNIIQFESTLGDSETTVYLNYYPDLRIDKTKRNGDTIYKLSNVVTGDEFTFASRSLVWPQGFV